MKIIYLLIGLLWLLWVISEFLPEVNTPIRCLNCGDAIHWQREGSYWTGITTGGECPKPAKNLVRLNSSPGTMKNSHLPPRCDTR